ncbi:MAG: hypothetical protein R3Y47_03570 [Lachnospiraceae bacterium]
MKKNNKIKTKTKVVETAVKGTEEEVFFMLPREVVVKELAGYVKCVDEDKVEIWNEMDLMEVVLEHDSLIFENMMDTFDTDEDLALLEKLQVKKVYSVLYNSLDIDQVKAVLAELHEEVNGFLASDTEDLEPMMEVMDL